MGRDDAEGYAVEHRTFGKLLDQLKELTAAQERKWLRHCAGGGWDAVRRVIEQRVSEAPTCPRCGAALFWRYGMEHGQQRWLRPHFQRPDWHAAGPAAQEGLLGMLANSLQRSHSVPSSAPGWGRQEHLVPLAPPFSAPGQRHAETAAYRHRRGRREFCSGKPQRRARAAMRGAQTRRKAKKPGLSDEQTRC